MGVGYLWRTYVCYIGAYVGEIQACFVWGIRVVYFGEYTWGLYLWVYVGVFTWGTYVGDAVYGYGVGDVGNRMVTGFVRCWRYGELL